VSSTAAEGGRRIIQVEKSSVAARAGLKVNDVLVSMDGERLASQETLNILMARKQWGDRARLVVMRDGKEQPITVVFRRDTPEGPPSSASQAPPAGPAESSARQ
jgi:S1-C subfamily serine protease